MFKVPGKCGLFAQGGAGEHTIKSSPSRETETNNDLGYDDVEHLWLAENGCFLSNTPYSVTEATADMGILLMLAALRGLYESETNVREGKWRTGLELTEDPTGMTIGFIGAGMSTPVRVGLQD